MRTNPFPIFRGRESEPIPAESSVHTLSDAYLSKSRPSRLSLFLPYAMERGSPSARWVLDAGKNAPINAADLWVLVNRSYQRIGPNNLYVSPESVVEASAYYREDDGSGWLYRDGIGPDVSPHRLDDYLRRLAKVRVYYASPRSAQPSQIRSAS